MINRHVQRPQQIQFCFEFSSFTSPPVPCYTASSKQDCGKALEYHTHAYKDAMMSSVNDRVGHTPPYHIDDDIAFTHP